MYTVSSTQRKIVEFKFERLYNIFCLLTTSTEPYKPRDTPVRTAGPWTRAGPRRRVPSPDQVRRPGGASLARVPPTGSAAAALLPRGDGSPASTARQTRHGARSPEAEVHLEQGICVTGTMSKLLTRSKPLLNKTLSNTRRQI